MNNVVHEVNAVKIMMVGREDSKFNFKVDKGLAMFVSARDGTYTLPITDTQHVTCSDTVEANDNYIEFISGEDDKATTAYVKIGNVLV